MLTLFLFPAISYPPALPVPSAKSFHPNSFTVVASTMIGYRPTVCFPNRIEEPKRKVRSDKGKKRKSIMRGCKLYWKHGGANIYTCRGPNARGEGCEYYNNGKIN